MSGKRADYIDAIKGIIKNNIQNYENEFYGYESEKKQIYDLIKKTVDYGESNSALLIGPRGSGKTTLVNKVLQESYKEETCSQNALLVKLHGLIHTDDKLSLKSITTQMNLDNAVDGKVFGSFAENLTFLLACLRSGHKETSKSVIFILDEFDLFCSHHNQTLLYNLFDISQSAQAPICIIGLTSRLDVIELLEKRVKSRFSHRQIFLLNGENGKENSFDTYMEHIKRLLCLNNSQLGNTNQQWNNEITKLFADKKLKSLIERLWSIDASKHTIQNVLFSVVSKLNKKQVCIKVQDFQEELNKYEEDEMVRLLRDLNILELCLIISMKHHCDIYDNEPLNFEIIYSRFLKFANANSSVQLMQRPVVIKAFEHILHLELIAPVNGANRSLQREYQMYKLLLSKSQINEAISTSTGLPTEVVQWSNSSLL